MAEDSGSNVPSPPSLKSFLDLNDKKNSDKSDKSKETEMTEKKDDGAAKDDADKAADASAPNDMKSWTIFTNKHVLNNNNYNIFYL